jgi:hypothetical protein
LGAVALFTFGKCPVNGPSLFSRVASTLRY